MIKFFLRRTIYKELDKESQDMLFCLTLKQHIIEMFCVMFWVDDYIFIFIPLFIIDICENIENSLITQIAIIAFVLMYFVEWLVSMKVFRRAIFGFSQLLAEKIYFLVCTTKGKALCKNEFNIIKQLNKKLYVFIATQKCQGYCYSICFEICKVLKKGL